MTVLLILLALALVAIGGAAVVFGVEYIQFERGWSMVIAGSVGASTGVALLGLAMLALRLGRIARDLGVIRDRLGSVQEVLDERAAAPSPAGASGALPAPPYESPPEPARTAAPAPGSDQTVVGRYASGGNNYVMFADGSITADTPTGQRRFSSLEELRAFVAAGGERGA